MKTYAVRRFWAVLGLFILIGFAIPFVNGRAERQRQMDAGDSARKVVIALKSYVSDHGGAYPATLDELVKVGLLKDKSELEGPRIPGWSNETGFVYLVADKKDDYDGNSWLIASQSHGPHGKRLIARNDGSVTMEIGPER